MAFPLDEKFITDTENELNVLFPNEFKTKMIQQNGGEVFTEDDNWQLYPFFDQSDKKRISRTCNHIGLETKQAREWINFPDDAVAIAGNGCGDHLVLLTTDGGKKLGEEIFIWHHETGEVEKTAETITELLDDGFEDEDFYF